jgi:hypothetical protein
MIGYLGVWEVGINYAHPAVPGTTEKLTATSATACCMLFRLATRKARGNFTTVLSRQNAQQLPPDTRTISSVVLLYVDV